MNKNIEKVENDIKKNDEVLDGVFKKMMDVQNKRLTNINKQGDDLGNAEKTQQGEIKEILTQKYDNLSEYMKLLEKENKQLRKEKEQLREETRQLRERGKDEQGKDEQCWIDVADEIGMS